ncbi:uncharacterized protein LOC131027600 isoform X1 [Cryptomeria japonica]|uniref:uncharacterized protein LOC131027600 isoform X1 n=1 Tax=Cryptomeria japonica TaxID=3369 RepID=UPI0027DA719D|nr:uncharacterized protein LOC131027600 isoform X1 [Cryptomeria japonica]
MGPPKLLKNKPKKGAVAKAGAGAKVVMESNLTDTVASSHKKSFISRYRYAWPALLAVNLVVGGMAWTWMRRMCSQSILEGLILTIERGWLLTIEMTWLKYVTKLTAWRRRKGYVLLRTRTRTVDKELGEDAPLVATESVLQPVSTIRSPPREK